jgi:hypothetical protein
MGDDQELYVVGADGRGPRSGSASASRSSAGGSDGKRAAEVRW